MPKKNEPELSEEELLLEKRKEAHPDWYGDVNALSSDPMAAATVTEPSEPSVSIPKYENSQENE